MSSLRSKVERIWALTATPILNKLVGLYHLVNLVKPGYLGTESSFRYRYLVTRKKEIRLKGGRKRIILEVLGYQNIEELRARLSPLVIARHRFYDLRFHYFFTQMSESQKELYLLGSKGVLDEAYLAEKEVDSKAHAPRLHDLQRILDGSHPKSEGDILVPKERLLLSAVKKLMEKDYAVIVYVEYRSTEQRLKRALHQFQEQLHIKNIFCISGEVPLADRVKIQDALSERSVLLVTTAGSQSLNLQRANCVILYDCPFSIGRLVQVLGRVTRLNSAYSMFHAIFVGCEDSLDEYKIRLVQDHVKLIRSIFGGSSILPKADVSLDRKRISDIRRKFLWKYMRSGNKEVKLSPLLKSNA